MLPPAVLDLAERQRGVFARYQAVRLTDVAWRVDNAMCSPLCAPVTPPIRGTRRIRGGAPVAEQFAMAAALRARPGATVTGPIVLGMLGIDGFATDAPFEILTRPGRRLTNVPFTHRCDPDPGRPVAKHGEVRVTGPVDALIDSAVFVEQLGPRALRVAWDQLRWRDLAREHRLVQRIAELWDEAPGAQALHEVLELGGGPRPESEGERGLGAILGCFAPEPEPQVWVTPNRRTDHYFRTVRTGFEYLGAVDHDHLAGRVADDARDAELREEGVRLHYVTARDLREPRVLLSNVAGMLTVRAHDLGVPPPVAVRPVPLDPAT